MSLPSLPPASINGASVIKWTGILSDLPSPPGPPGSREAPARVRRRTRQAPGARPVPPLRPAAPLPDPAMVGLFAVPDPAPPYDDDLPAEPARHPAACEAPGHVGADPAITQRETSQAGPGERESARAGDRPGSPGSAANAGAPGRTTDALAVAERGSVAGATPAAKQMRADKRMQAAWPNLFAQVLAEALAGSRSARQLSPWTTQQARGHIRRLGPLLRASREPQASRPGSFAGGGKRSMASEPRVRRVVASMPSADVVEMAVVVRFGPRVRALAVRLEQPGGKEWICTAIEAA
jgi:Family of unknown function (DUF6459)